MTGQPAVPRSLRSPNDSNNNNNNNNINNNINKNILLSISTSPLQYKYDVCLSYRVAR